MLAIVLADIGFALTVIGFLTAVRPVRWLWVSTRGRALGLALGGIVIATIALLLPAAEHVASPPVSALDRLMPVFQFAERHSIEIRATPDRIHRAIKEVTAGEIRLFQTLVWVRRFGQRGPESILNAPADRPLLDVATRTTFAVLADDPREVVVGTVVVAPPGFIRGEPPTAGETLAVRDKPGFAIAAMNFAIVPHADGTCVLTTETRVYATDAAARRRFAVYWRIIYPGSALIRRMWLRAIRSRAERPEGQISIFHLCRACGELRSDPYVPFFGEASSSRVLRTSRQENFFPLPRT